MKKIVFVLLLIISILLFFGCTQNQAVKNSGSEGSSQWSEEVSALGEPTYDKVIISTGYEILPFPGLKYTGLRDNWQAFYSKNDDYTFAIYASPQVMTGVGTYEDVKQQIQNEYSVYSSSLKCEDISTSGWLTNTKAFSCSYVYSDYISYKIVTFYKDNSYVQTNLSVWGTSLQNYAYVFDEFNQKAVSWK